MKYILSILMTVFLATSGFSANLRKPQIVAKDLKSNQNPVLETKEVLNKKDNCFDIFAAKCLQGYEISKNKRTCEKTKVKSCDWNLPEEGVAEFKTEMVGSCEAKTIVSCKDGYVLKGKNKSAKCEKESSEKPCDYKASDEGVLEWGEVEDKKNKCLATVPVKCEKDYDLYKPDMPWKTMCKKGKKSSRR
ncbi:MAG: hypothetical protein JXR30_00285 [Alphaproteobacteria bacterium]|nr:hypothetical protein [Alphaproteobacteria bacterium]